MCSYLSVYFIVYLQNIHKGYMYYIDEYPLCPDKDLGLKCYNATCYNEAQVFEHELVFINSFLTDIRFRETEPDTYTPKTPSHTHRSNFTQPSRHQNGFHLGSRNRCQLTSSYPRASSESNNIPALFYKHVIWYWCYSHLHNFIET